MTRAVFVVAVVVVLTQWACGVCACVRGKKGERREGVMRGLELELACSGREAYEDRWLCGSGLSWAFILELRGLGPWVP